jgi:hypothetical protein
MEVISRKEAKERGLKRYFTGKPCKHGHVAERFINRICVECSRSATRRWREENHDKELARVQRWKSDKPAFGSYISIDRSLLLSKKR